MAVGGACMDQNEANASCGAGYVFARNACVPKPCPPGTILNTASGACDQKAAIDRAVASSAGLTIKAGQEISCNAGFTYVVSGTDGACVPNDALCGVGTKWDGSRCVAQANCGAGEVLDPTTGACSKLATTSDDSKLSVSLKLKAALGPAFCTPLASNPIAFGVQPGGSLSVTVAVSISIPGNDIEKTTLTAVTIAGGSGALADGSPGVNIARKQADDQIVTGIRALGGKSLETSAQADVSCTIRRAQVQVVESHGGGI